MTNLYIILPVYLILFTIDIVATYYIVKKHRKVFPKSNWKKIELNPIARLFWTKYELFWGTIYSGIVVLPIIVMASLLSTMSSFFFGFILGVYFLTLRIHIASYKQLSKIEKKKQEIRDKRRKAKVITD